MPESSPDLHGSAPDSSPVALLLIDLINDLDFAEADQLARHARPMAAQVATLKARCRSLGIPAVYVNDNFGRWRSDLQAQIRHVLEESSKGRFLVEALRPGPDDYYVVKPKHSGFYSTTLDLLLRHLEARTLILTGVAGNICVLFTANDAYMRDYKLIVPADCVASNTDDENRHALDQMARVLKADVRPSAELDLEAILGELRRQIPA